MFGLIVAGLKARRDKNVPPFTAMSCDNIPGNGEVTHAAVSGLARLHDRVFADWIEANVAFPDGMVDRITPEPACARSPSSPTTTASRTPGRCSAKSSSNACSKTFSARTAGSGEGGCPVRARRSTLRAHEDPHPQRWPCGDRLSRGASRHPFRARGNRRAADPRLSLQARA
ncbi:hypothetical protein [Ensifer sp. 22521]|uniref:hypothetical protein n=1 Tax=Ensifer sp. 22521 TaxID=3453935 RepID=UPI003F87A43A